MNDLTRWIIFDADNTLWETEVIYDVARDEMCEYLAAKSKTSKREIESFQKQRDAELHKAYAYSASRFPRSFEDTCSHFLPAADPNEVRHVRRIAEAVFEKKAKMFAGVEQLLRSAFAASYRLGLLTAGEKWVQEKRIRDFHLRGIFRAIEVVDVKNEAAFSAFCRKYGVEPEQSWLVGDSLRSDIKPALAVGLNAIWVPNANWREAEHDDLPDNPRFRTVNGFSDIYSVINFPILDPRPIAEEGIRVLGLFEGGGAKGLAHVGGLKAAEERKVRFLGVAGSSAGAIVAALVAVGYTADELFEAANNRGLPFNQNWLELLGHDQWERGVRFSSSAQRLGRSLMRLRTTGLGRLTVGTHCIGDLVAAGPSSSIRS